MKKFKIFIFFLLLLFIVHCSLTIKDCPCQWVQQNLPVPAAAFMDMKFVNINTGFIAQYNYGNGQSTFLKTTNEGYNWQVINNFGVSSISILDSMYIYVNGYNNLYSKLYKSTNGGLTWDSLLPAYNIAYSNLYFFNRDTGLISGGNGDWSYIWRTINGGLTKELIVTINWSTPGKIFFIKEKVNGEYYGLIYNGPAWYKTTNSGLSWLPMPNIPTSYQTKSIFFLNKDTGWASIANSVNYVYYTTNGGINWGTQILPGLKDVCDIFFANPRKGWIGCYSQTILATTNGGLNWGTQIISGGSTSKLFFLDSLIGWAGNGNAISFTTNGGGPITRIVNKEEQIAKDFVLEQNYPNPFNAMTKIKFSIPPFNPPLIKGGRGLPSGGVSLKVYDILGKEVSVLVNEKLSAGSYEVTFNGSKFPSGVYFYKLTAGDFIETKKLILIK